MQALVRVVCAGLSADRNPFPLHLEVTGAHRMTGIDFRVDRERNTTDAIALAFPYMSFAGVSPAECVWNRKHCLSSQTIDLESGGRFSAGIWIAP